MKVKSAAAIAEKFVRVTPGRLEDYEAGVRDPQEDWEKNTAAAEDNYEKSTKEAMTRKAFGKGVRKTGTAKQQRKTIEKGVEEGRWVGGVQAAGPDMQAGMEPVVAVLEKTSLPPRQPKGDPRNMERSSIVVKALIKMKREA